jgi:multidrug transporter EmrE-like cation transporter
VSERLLGISFAVVAVLLESMGHLFLKQAAERHFSGANLLRMLRGAYKDKWFVIGITCFVLEFVCWTLALQRLDVSLAYQLGCLSFVGVALLSRLLLREQICVTRWVGITCVLLGSILVGMS